MRSYPVLDEAPVADLEPISFIVVQFCDEYYHNILKSACVADPRNQLVTVDNRWGHRYDTLSAAINDGLDQAAHDLIVVVHEDVWLPDGWQDRLHRVLTELETVDPDWGLAGSVGFSPKHGAIGHWSDPHRYRNTFRARNFAPVTRLDEQILIFRKSSGLRFDPELPSIHNIGRDLASHLKRARRKTYALNAPTVHKYADAEGHLIEAADDSEKIVNRRRAANLSDWMCSNAYLAAKWPEWELWPDPAGEDFSESGALNRCGPPVIALARGGSGSRLLWPLMQDLGVFMGWGLRNYWKRRGVLSDNPFEPTEIRPSGDADVMRDAVYRGVFARYQNQPDWMRAQVVPRLRANADRMLRHGGPKPPWGFKLPESLLILPDLDAAFPGARYVHLIRDPLTTCLRRPHMTARFDNAVGRTAIRTAYTHAGRDVSLSLQDSPSLRMAYTTRHQIETTRTYAGTHLQGRYLELRFEDLIADPGATLTQTAAWLDRPITGTALTAAVDPGRAKTGAPPYPPETAAGVADVLQDLRQALGYVP